jgi:hypothetical protein
MTNPIRAIIAWVRTWIIGTPPQTPMQAARALNPELADDNTPQSPEDT